jgi:hypothetical protein
MADGMRPYRQVLKTHGVFSFFSNPTQDIVGIHATPMFVFIPSKKWEFQASIGSLSWTSHKNYSGFNLSLGVLNMGLSYYLRKG